jgi:hypothetical protein
MVAARWGKFEKNPERKPGALTNPGFFSALKVVARDGFVQHYTPFGIPTAGVHFTLVL